MDSLLVQMHGLSVSLFEALERRLIAGAAIDVWYRYPENGARAATPSTYPFERLDNVRFKWSDRVYIDAGNMALRAEPLEGHYVDFDDPSSFVMNVQQSSCDERCMEPVWRIRLLWRTALTIARV